MQHFALEALTTLATGIFAAQGTPEDEAAMVAEQLVESNLVGLDSHGVVRIPLYTRWIGEGVIRPGAPVSVVREEGGTAIVDCGRNFGQVGALRTIEVAIDKAKVNKVACVVSQNCCHVGRLGYFVEIAARAGFVALATVNSPKTGHSVVPFGGREGRISPNPMAYAVPGPDQPMVADMALSTTSQGKVIVYRNRGEQVPEGWLIDAHGQPTTDPEILWSDPPGWILPLGGTIGYKGFALLLLAEILSGTLSGHSMTDDIPDGTNGLCLILIDISAFEPLEQFRRAIGDMVGYVKSAPPAPGFEQVIVPGEIDLNFADQRARDGIPLDSTTWGQIRKVAESLNVPVPVAIS